MVYFVQTIYRLPNGTGHLLPPLQPKDQTKALADLGTNGIIMLFVDMKGICHGRLSMKATCSVASCSDNGYVRRRSKQLHGAPKFGEDRDWDWADPARNRALDDYYGVPIA